jgi:hypothetical protein
MRRSRSWDGQGLVGGHRGEGAVGEEDKGEDEAGEVV